MIDWETMAFRRVDKTWGRELWLVNTDLYCAKILEVEHSKGGSYHEHRVKDETFIVLQGSIILIVGTGGYWARAIRLDEGDRRRLHRGVPHLVIGLSRRTARILEISTQHNDTDVIRHWRLNREHSQR